MRPFTINPFLPQAVPQFRTSWRRPNAAGPVPNYPAPPRKEPTSPPITMGAAEALHRQEMAAAGLGNDGDASGMPERSPMPDTRRQVELDIWTGKPRHTGQSTIFTCNAE
jgi:hypothetical protein